MALAICLGLAAAGCGNKRPPKAPPRMVASPTTDLEVSQRGAELQFAFTYPDVTVSGQPLDGIEAVELWRMTRPLQPPPPEDEEEGEESGEEGEPAEEEPAEEEAEAEEPPAAASPFLFRRPPETVLQAEQRIQVDPREFAALAALELRIEAAELQAAISGDRVLLRLPLELPPPEVPEEERDLEVFAVICVSTRGLDSAFSNVVKILPRTPPEPPEKIDTLPDARGVDVIWEAEDPPVGFRVYRRDAASRAYGTPIAQPGPGARTHLDQTASFGSRYVYSVAAVGLDSPLVESALAAEREVQYDDRYPPAPPTGLIVLGEAGRARVLWEPSAADDLAGYLVYRRAADGAGFDRLTAEPDLELSYLDTTVASGQAYSYYVSAVDLSGNESAAGETVDVEIP